MNKKYELTDRTKVIDGVTVHQIRALKYIEAIGLRTGVLGGFVESENNLSHTGDCWISSNAVAYGNSKVLHNAQLYDKAVIGENAIIQENSEVYDRGKVFGNAIISGYAEVSGDAIITDNARIFGYSTITDSANVYGCAQIRGTCIIRDNALVYDCRIGDVIVGRDAIIKHRGDVVSINGFGSRNGELFAWRTNDGFLIKCGCFMGNVNDFVNAVFDTHKDSPQYRQEYFNVAVLLNDHFNGGLSKDISFKMAKDVFSRTFADKTYTIMK